MNRPWPGAVPCFVDGMCQDNLAERLRRRFRLIWEQHVYWTRLVILSIAAGAPDLEAATERLLRNAPEMARLFGRFYGAEVTAKLGCLLHGHLVIAAELVKAAKAGDQEAAEAAQERWYANGAEIVHLLSCLNPCWPRECLQEMWFEHLALTKAEAVARLDGDYARDIEVFDRIEKQALMMADGFAAGISRQFGLRQ